MSARSPVPQTERFEHYEVLRREDGSLWELGRGAMGVTYKAFDTDLHCHVALKVIHPDILGSEGAQQRFLREARAAAQLRHPNIATVLRLGRAEDGSHFYAMEFCEGETLEQVVEAKGPFDVATALEITAQIAKGLVSAEEHHVVHRDIKPANLILHRRRDGELVVKIIDFGLAKAAAGAGAANPWSSRSMHTAGFAGTAHFSSPEQIEEGDVDVRSDIYSLGATLWFMLTGKPMFSGALARVLAQHLSASPPFEQLDRGLPRDVRDLVARMLEKDPAARPQTALDLHREIGRCLAALRESAAPARGSAYTRPRAGTVLDGRWELLEDLDTGQSFRAADLTQERRTVLVRMLGPIAARDEARWRELEHDARVLKTAPQGFVRVLALERARPQAYAVTEWINGVPLLTVLRRRGSLAVKETLWILGETARAIDFAIENELLGFAVSKQHLMLAFSEQMDLARRLDEVFAQPLTHWPELRLVANALDAQEDGAAGESFASMETMLPGRVSKTGAKVPSKAERTAALVTDAANLSYELLGGTAPRGPITAERYVPLARLTAEGNAILKRAMTCRAEECPFADAHAFHAALAATATYEPAWQPPPPMPTIDNAVAVATPNAPSLPRRQTQPPTRLLLIAAACALAAVVAYLVWPKGDRSTPAQTSSPAPAAATTPIAQTAPSIVPRPSVSAAPSATPNPLANVAVLPQSISPDGRYGVTVPTQAQRGTAAGTHNHLVEVNSRRSLLEIPAAPWFTGTSERDGVPAPRWSADGTTLAWVVEGRWETRTYMLAKVVNGSVTWQLDLLPFVQREMIGQSKALAYDRYYSVRQKIGGNDSTPSEGFLVSIESPPERFTLPLERRVSLTSDPRGDAENAGAAFLNASQIAIIDQWGGVRFRGFNMEGAASPTPTPIPTVTPVPVAQNSDAAFKAFIAAHEETEQSRNMEAILAGYAPTVDFFDYGRIDHTALRKNKTEYFERWPRARHWIVGPIDARATTSERWVAKYRIGFRVENDKGEWIEGETENDMGAYFSGGKYLIDYQRGKVLRSQKGNAAGAISGPRYTGQGRVYKVPDLQSLVGKRLTNAWLYGDFVLKSWDGNTARLVTAAMGLMAKEGTTQVMVEYAGGIQLSEKSLATLRDPMLVLPVRYNANDPLQLLSVSKLADGRLLVKARARDTLR